MFLDQTNSLNYGTGLVLKNYYPNKNQIVILSDQGQCFLARAAFAIKIETLRPGYWLTYNLLAQKPGLKITKVQIISTPDCLDYQGLQFLHQVLELCHLTIPVGQVTSEAVNLLRFLNQNNPNIWSATQKRLFICCLLAVVGFYPDSLKKDYLLLHKIGKLSTVSWFDFINFELDTQTDVFLVKWITNFVSSHLSGPLAGLFTTVCQN